MVEKRIRCGGVVVLAALLWTTTPCAGQDVPPTSGAIAEALWAAVQPALPYPAAAAADDTPVDGRVEALWLVRRLDGEDGRIFEVIANPLNVENQARAAKAMADIRAAVTEAERRAQTEYERSLGTTSRQNPTRDLAGISLDDEGVEGERADWEAKLVAELRIGQAQYTWQVAGPGTPSLSPTSRGIAVFNDADEYDDASSDAHRRRYRPAEARVYFGTKEPSIGVPASTQGARVDTASAGGAKSVEVTLRGNTALLRQVLAKSDWSRVAALVP